MKACWIKGLAVLAVSIVALALPPSAMATSQSAGDTAAVEGWVQLELQAIASNRVNPPRASRALALLSVAMDRAARASGRGSKPAIDAAAVTVLDYLFPNLGLSTEPAAAGRRQWGSALGRRIASQLVARAKRDGSDATWTGSVPAGPDVWVPTPPAFISPPLEPNTPNWRPWNLRSGSQFRPGPPPPSGSAGWLAEVQEVYDVSKGLTEEQKAIALRWADGAGTATPPGHWTQIALGLIRDHSLQARQATRVLATLNTAQADAFIACWDTKYTYWTMRPVTAIRSSIDPTWSPLITTPPFPSYPSGHATTSGAASTVLGRFFRAQAGELRAMASEAALSRLLGGIHFSSDNAAGLELGRRVGQAAVRAYR